MISTGSRAYARADFVSYPKAHHCGGLDGFRLRGNGARHDEHAVTIRMVEEQGLRLAPRNQGGAWPVVGVTTLKSQTKPVWSKLAVTSRFPSGVKAIDDTPLRCPDS